MKKVSEAPGNGKTLVHLFYDGEKYKNPVFVGYNGKTYLIKRGVDVLVPLGVANILRNSEEQDRKTKNMILGMERDARELNV